MTDAPARSAAAMSGPTFSWLVAAFCALIFTIGNQLVAVAGWLAPLLMLRFVRSAGRRGLALGALASGLAPVVAWRGLLPFQGPAYFAVTAAVGVLMFTPYVVDHIASRRLTGSKLTLVFPAAFVATEFVLSRAGFGTWGLLAYSQSGQLPLLQLLGVTGMAGVSFLICWGASVANALWDGGGRDRGVRMATGLFLVVMTTVLAAGGLAVARQDRSPTVRVAGLSLDNMEAFRGTWAPLSYGMPLTHSQAAEAAPKIHALQQTLLAQSRAAARNGAQVVVWSEANAMVVKAEESAFVAQAQRVAADEGIYLFMALASITPGQPRAENKVVVIDPAGAILAIYLKSHPTPGEMSVPGDGRMRLLETPLGAFAVAICYDYDYPELIRQAGRAGADILIDPSWEHRGMDPLHTQMALFRGIENGAALFRPVNGGLSMAADARGRVLAATRGPVMVADLPKWGRRTAYPFLRDLLPWASVAWLLGVAFILSARERPLVG